MIGNQSAFITQAKKDMPDFIKQAIDGLLTKLDSKINYPMNQGRVIESRLLKVVQSREQVYLSIVELMDIIKIDKSSDSKYKKRIIQGMITTWHELTKIICRDIGSIEETEDMDTGETIFDIHDNFVSDDHLSSIAKSKVIASNLAKLILDRIAMLDDPESVNNEKQEKYELPSISERYAK